MATYTLDAIREAADAKYGSTDIAISDMETVRLLNPLRLPKTRRDTLMDLQKQLEAEGSDQVAIIQETIRTVAENRHLADRLIEMVGDDLATLAQIAETYGEGQQMGEASASVS